MKVSPFIVNIKFYVILIKRFVIIRLYPAMFLKEVRLIISEENSVCL